MENYKLPTTKLTLKIIKAALSDFRVKGMFDKSVEQIVKLHGEWQDKFKKAGSNEVKQLEAILGMSKDEVREKQAAFKKIETDVNITIAKIEIILRRLENADDSIMVDNLLEEIMKGTD